VFRTKHPALPVPKIRGYASQHADHQHKSHGAQTCAQGKLPGGALGLRLPLDVVPDFADPDENQDERRSTSGESTWG